MAIKILLLMFYMAFNVNENQVWPLTRRICSVDVTPDWDGPIVIRELSLSSSVQYIRGVSVYSGVQVADTAVCEIEITGSGGNNTPITTVPEAAFNGLGAMYQGQRIAVNCQSNWYGSLPMNVSTTLRAVFTYHDDPSALILLAGIPDSVDAMAWLTIGFEFQGGGYIGKKKI